MKSYSYCFTAALAIIAASAAFASPAFHVSSTAYSMPVPGIVVSSGSNWSRAPFLPHRIVRTIHADDAAINSQVQHALVKDRSITATNSKVATRDGKVAVTGEASSQAEKSRVTNLTAAVHGVKSVNNTMSIANE